MPRTGVPQKAHDELRPKCQPIDDTKAVFRIVRQDGSTITFGRPFAAIIIAICLAIIILHAGLSPSATKGILSVLPKWWIP
jgi:hypothetical protein